MGITPRDKYKRGWAIFAIFVMFLGIVVWYLTSPFPGVRSFGTCSGTSQERPQSSTLCGAGSDRPASSRSMPQLEHVTRVDGSASDAPLGIASRGGTTSLQTTLLLRSMLFKLLGLPAETCQNCWRGRSSTEHAAVA